MGFQIAIDGPGGAGKSTVAKLAAKKLGFTYIDTGAMYRAVGLYARQKGADLSDGNEVAAVLPDISIDVIHDASGAQRLFLNGSDVTGEIRGAEAGEAASRVAVYAEVREALVSRQRKLAENKNIIMDGRDIGTAVLPEADIKIYMDADVESRVRRRVSEFTSKNNAAPAPPEIDIIRREITERDERDKNRALSPLVKADGAVIIDTSDLTIDEALEAVIKLAKTAGKG